MNEKLDITKFAGRKFTAKSGNRAIIAILEEGAIRATWKVKPSKEDSNEFIEWIEHESNELIEPYISIAGKIGEEANKKEKEDLELWKKKIK